MQFCCPRFVLFFQEWGLVTTFLAPSPPGDGTKGSAASGQVTMSLLSFPEHSFRFCFGAAVSRPATGCSRGPEGRDILSMGEWTIDPAPVRYCPLKNTKIEKAPQKGLPSGRETTKKSESPSTGASCALAGTPGSIPAFLRWGRTVLRIPFHSPHKRSLSLSGAGWTLP